MSDILRISTGRKSNEDVVLFSECLYLTTEDGIEAIIVADAGKNGRVGVQGYRWERATVITIATDQLFAKVHGVGGTAAVATGKNSFPALQSIDYECTSRFNQTELWFECIETIFECLIIFLKVGHFMKKL